jgi:hypothetical protein
MDREVHYEFTRRWAVQEGFTEDDAELVAASDWAVDDLYNVHESWHNKGYHFAWLGAYRRAKRLSAEASEEGDLRKLGVALHCLQDAVAHGNLGHLYHWDGIDRWNARSPRVRARIEGRSRSMLAAYRTAARLKGSL